MEVESSSNALGLWTGKVLGNRDESVVREIDRAFACPKSWISAVGVRLCK